MGSCLTQSDVCSSRSTGKERDTESGLDYFGARHYSSAIGRFMSPDWSVNPEPVPFANFQNPQSLNLYAYAANNPLSDYDMDGHCDTKTQDVWCMLKTAWNWLNSSSQNAQTATAQASTNFVVHSTILGLNSYNKTDTFIQQHPIAAGAANAAMV
jgi:RHS repeat-associated protein